MLDGSLDEDHRSSNDGLPPSTGPARRFSAHNDEGPGTPSFSSWVTVSTR
jgi:hypothetical protein